MLPGLARLRDRYDAFLLDLDGTLLDGNSRIGERTAAAVRTLVDLDFKVVLCSGRSAAGMRGHHSRLGLDEPFVAYNGHWIGNREGFPWHRLLIPDDLADCIHAAERFANFSFRHADERKYTLLSGHPDHFKIAAWYEHVTETHEPTDLPRAELMRVTMFFDGQAAIEPAWAAMSEMAQRGLQRIVVPLRVFPAYGDSTLVMCEVQARSQGKAEAFAWLESHYGIPAERTIAVGDHVNDQTMLAGAGLAVAPENVAPEVRPLAHLVIGHHRDEGFAEWIEAGAPLGNGDAP